MCSGYPTAGSSPGAGSHTAGRYRSRGALGVLLSPQFLAWPRACCQQGLGAASQANPGSDRWPGAGCGGRALCGHREGQSSRHVPMGWMCVCAMGPHCPEGQCFVPVPAQDEGGHAGHWSPGWCVSSVSQLITPALSRKIPEPGCLSSGHDHEARTWHLCPFLQCLGGM